jgi:hypothetical protein
VHLAHLFNFIAIYLHRPVVNFVDVPDNDDFDHMTMATGPTQHGEMKAASAFKNQ